MASKEASDTVKMAKGKNVIQRLVQLLHVLCFIPHVSRALEVL